MIRFSRIGIFVFLSQTWLWFHNFLNCFLIAITLWLIDERAQQLEFLMKLHEQQIIFLCRLYFKKRLRNYRRNCAFLEFSFNYHQSFTFKGFDPFHLKYTTCTHNCHANIHQSFSVLNFLGIKIRFERFASCFPRRKITHREEIDIPVVRLRVNDLKWNM